MPTTVKPVTLHVPAALDLEALFDEADRDYAAYFLDLLHRKMATWDFDKIGFSRLQHKYLTQYIPKRRLTRIRSILEAEGVIDVDRSYSAGRRSIGYRLEPQHWESKAYECRNTVLAGKLRDGHQEWEGRLLPVHRWLRRQLRRVHFNHDLAETIIAGMRPGTRSKLTVPEYQTLIRESCKRFKPGGRRYFAVDRYGRVHTTITSLPSALRPCLTIDGQNLVGIDLTSSQPLIAGIVAQRFTTSRLARHRMLTRDFGSRTTPYATQEVIAMQHRHQAQEGSQGQPSHRASKFPSNMWCACPDDAANQGVCLAEQVKRSSPPGDLQKYLRLCELGQLYEHLMEPGEDRGAVKRGLFRDVFFGRTNYPSPLRDRFEAEFPTMGRVLRALKRKGYEHAARLMQSYESTLFIAIICARLMRERPDLFVLTIHDSILTVLDEVEYVRQVILDEFAKLGIVPSLKEERYE